MPRNTTDEVDIFIDNVSLHRSHPANRMVKQGVSRLKVFIGNLIDTYWTLAVETVCSHLCLLLSMNVVNYYNYTLLLTSISQDMHKYISDYIHRHSIAESLVPLCV
jgi:hypothetical protein